MAPTTLSIRVILERLTPFYLPGDVRFAPKATKLLRCREVTRHPSEHPLPPMVAQAVTAAPIIAIGQRSALVKSGIWSNLSVMFRLNFGSHIPALEPSPFTHSFPLPPILRAIMEARTPATYIPGYSRARLKRIIAAGNVAACAIGFWTILFPIQLYTVGLLLCVLLPLWALVLEMRTRGALGFEARRGRRYPLSIATILLLPALALAGRATVDLNFESYSPLIAATALTALAMFILFWRFDPQLRGDLNQGVTIAIFALAYCYGALALADVRLDASSGQDTQTLIHHKRIHVSGGPKGGSAWYQVKVDPEASPAGANWINVQPDLWDSFHRGDTVCVHVGTGLLAIPWYAVGRCAG